MYESKLNQYMMEAYLFLMSGIWHSIGRLPAVAAVQNVACVMTYDRLQFGAVGSNLIEICWKKCKIVKMQLIFTVFQMGIFVDVVSGSTVVKAVHLSIWGLSIL